MPTARVLIHLPPSPSPIIDLYHVLKFCAKLINMGEIAKNYHRQMNKTALSGVKIV